MLWCVVDFLVLVLVCCVLCVEVFLCYGDVEMCCVVLFCM
jgi:hypothetical protein